jgi:hypothetical protein
MDAVRPENHYSDKARERDRPHFAASLSTSPEPFVKRRARQVELVGYTGSKAARFQSDAEKSQNVEPRPSNQDLRKRGRGRRHAPRERIKSVDPGSKISEPAFLTHFLREAAPLRGENKHQNRQLKPERANRSSPANGRSGGVQAPRKRKAKYQGKYRGRSHVSGFAG